MGGSGCASAAEAGDAGTELGLFFLFSVSELTISTGI